VAIIYCNGKLLDIEIPLTMILEVAQTVSNPCTAHGALSNPFAAKGASCTNIVQ
jgi:hypothetical protein